MATVTFSNRVQQFQINDLELEADIPWKALADTCFKLTQYEQFKDYEISLSFCDEEEIRELNRDYRDKHAVTDVLSFPQLESTELENGKAALLEINPSLGDIIICLKRAKEQAEEYRHHLKRELAFLFVHGLLHLLGYDHEDEKEAQRMFALQEAVLLEHGISR